MPQWILLLGLAIVSWLVLALVGGIVLGKVLSLAERRLKRPRQRPVSNGRDLSRSA
jgi:hypothetical protein